MATTAELLTSIEAAIAGNPNGILVSEYNGRRIERMSLTDLYKLRALLKQEAAADTQGTMFIGLSPRNPN